MKKLLIIFAFLISGCTGVPDGITPVSDFNVDRYLGKWYEIARFDHSFERGMHQVTAEYSLRPDGGIKVINRGFVEETKQWQQAEGRAYFVGEPTIGHLKVSFFGPFYGSYIVFDLDENYQYSLIASSNKSYFWLLSRTPTMDKQQLNQLFTKVSDLGFDINNMIIVDQTDRDTIDSRR